MNPKQENFICLYETIRYLVVIGSPEELFLITVSAMKNRKFFIHTTEGEFQTLFPGQSLTSIGELLKAEMLKAIFQTFILSFLP